MSLKSLLQTNVPKSLLIGLLCLIAAAGTTLGNYSLTFAINVLKAGNFSRFMLIMGLFAGLQLLGFLCSVVNDYLFAAQVQAHLHLRRRQLTAAFYHTDSQPTAAMQNRLTNDLKMLNENFAQPLLSIFNAALTLIFSCFALFTFHWSLLLLVLVLAVAMLFLPNLLAPQLQAVTLKVSQSNNQYLDAIGKWLGGLSEIKRYAARNKLFATLSGSSHGLEQSIMHRALTVCTLNFINLFSNVFAQFTVIALAGFLISRGFVTFGVILSAGQFAEIIFNGVVTISNDMGAVISTKSLNQEILTLAHTQPHDHQTSTDSLNDLATITTHDLKLNYSNGEQLTFPDITINAGEKVLLTGDSGSGKSTLLQLIVGKIQPSQGAVVFHNDHGTPLDLDQAKIGYIPQDATLFPATITDNITMFDAALAAAVPATVADVALAPDIANFPAGLQTTIDLDHPNFSGGQRQKIVLARAQIHRRQLLLLDECTSAIDRENTLIILKHLLASSATIIFVAHNLDQQMIQLFDRQIHITKTER